MTNILIVLTVWCTLSVAVVTLHWLLFNIRVDEPDNEQTAMYPVPTKENK